MNRPSPEVAGRYLGNVLMFHSTSLDDVHTARLLLMADAPVTAAPLPDEAEVCACAGVTAGRLRRCADLPAAVAGTRATTGCGGCVQTVKELVGTAIGL